MIKVYKWSDVLNYLANAYQDGENFNVILDKAIGYINENIQDDFYRYTSILLIRSGSPINNANKLDNREELNPYYVNLDSEEARFILHFEYRLWCKLKQLFRDFDITFMHLKDMYESDIIRYISRRRKIVEEDFGYGLNLISAYHNSLHDSKSTFYYPIIEIDKCL